MTAVEAISPALEHTKQQLFKPFRIGQWTKLAFVGLLAGELGSSGFNRSNFQYPSHPGAPPHTLGVDPALLVAFIAAVTVAGLAIGLILMYVGSVMRFILFDSVMARQCNIRWGWNRRLGPGWRYFVFKLLYFLVALAGIAVLVGIPVAIVHSQGWLSTPKEHLPSLVLIGIILFLVLLIFLVATAVILVLTKDFVVPQMALEDVSAMEGWRRLWAMMEAEKGAYAAYIAMKIVLSIVAGIMIGISAAILAVIFVVPALGLSILAVVTGKAAGLTWNANTIALAIIIGCILLGIFLYLVSLLSVPAIVFFPAFSIYFLAPRYPQLAAALNPASPVAQVPARAAPLSP
jgi:hypothetical protein